MSAGLLNYAGLLLGLLSILVTVYFAIRYAERKDPRFCSLNQRKIAVSEDAPEDIQISYKGQRVDRICSTLVWFWNSGKRPIKKEDIPHGQPLLIKLTDSDVNCEILDVSIRKTSRAVINFTAVKNDTSTVRLDFDFLDKSDGAAIEIQHTGTRSTSVEVSGVILGASKGVRGVSRPGMLEMLSLIALGPLHAQRSRPLRLLSRLVATLLMIAVVTFFGFLLFRARSEITTTRELLHIALGQTLKGDQLNSAVQSIEDTSRYKIVNVVFPYFFGFILLIDLIFGLTMMWRSPYAFPHALMIDDKPDDDGKKSSGNATDAESADAQQIGYERRSQA